MQQHDLPPLRAVFFWWPSGVVRLRPPLRPLTQNELATRAATRCRSPPLFLESFLRVFRVPNPPRSPCGVEDTGPLPPLHVFLTLGPLTPPSRNPANNQPEGNRLAALLAE